MKTLVIYYSYSGHTKRLAQEFAEKENADLIEVKELSRPGRFLAYTTGCFAAIRQKSRPIEALSVNWDDYDKITILGPVWAGFPAPPVNSVIEQLPAGQKVEIIMVSASGTSRGREKVIDLVKGRFCDVLGYQDLKD